LLRNSKLGFVFAVGLLFVAAPGRSAKKKPPLPPSQPEYSILGRTTASSRHGAVYGR